MGTRGSEILKEGVDDLEHFCTSQTQTQSEWGMAKRSMEASWDDGTVR